MTDTNTLLRALIAVTVANVAINSMIAETSAHNTVPKELRDQQRDNINQILDEMKNVLRAIGDKMSSLIADNFI